MSRLSPETQLLLHELTGGAKVQIRQSLTCPHCWGDFPVDKILFISESPELLGDTKLSDVDQRRFSPQRFDVEGAALDSRGFPCHKLACPICHLPIPRSMLDAKTFFISIAGAPASGKSYFLTSLCYRLRHTMPNKFCLNFTDADTVMNQRIRDYESMQFLGDDPNRLVSIEKTDVSGSIYNTTQIDGQTMNFAQPFVFSILPTPAHPAAAKYEKFAQTVCMYDNAGESFLPGSDHLTSPVTRHLASSDAILFLFDPTQDPRFKAKCTREVSDPQMNANLGGEVRRSAVRQETVLTEMINRIRTLNRMSPREKSDVPLIIVLTKFDAWQQLATFPNFRKPWRRIQNSPLRIFDVPLVKEYSAILRNLLLELIPDLVSTAETFARNVAYIAVSATGGSPEVDPSDSRRLCYRCGSVNPVWVETPFLYAQTLANKYCVPILK